MRDASEMIGVHKETRMILEILLSIVITFGAGLTADFGECPAGREPETVAAQQG